MESNQLSKQKLFSSPRSFRWTGVPQRWWRIIIPVGVVLAAIVLGVAAALVNPLFVVGLMAIVPFIGFCELVLRRIELGLLAIFVSAAFIPLSFSTGTQSRLVFSLLVAIVVFGLWLLRAIGIERRILLIDFPGRKPLLFFMGMTVFTLIWSNLLRDPVVEVWGSFPVVQIAQTVVLFILPAVLLLVASYLKNLFIVKIMIILTVLVGVVGTITNYLGTASLVNSNGLFMMWFMNMTISIVLFAKGLKLLFKILLVGAALAWFNFAFGQNIEWLAGWVPSIIVISILCFLRSWRWFLAFILIILVFVGANLEYLQSVYALENAMSGQTRLAAWEANWRVTGQHWLFGTGPAGYAVYYMHYFPLEAMATHNNYLDLLAQMGIVGLAAFLLFLFQFLRFGWRIVHQLKGRGDLYEIMGHFAFAGTLGCAIMMAFGDWVFPFAYTQTIAGFDYAVYNMLFMGMLPAVARMLSLLPAGETPDG